MVIASKQHSNVYEPSWLECPHEQVMIRMESHLKRNTPIDAITSVKQSMPSSYANGRIVFQKREGRSI